MSGQESVQLEWQHDLMAGAEVLRAQLVDADGKVVARLEIFEPLGVPDERKEQVAAVARAALAEFKRSLHRPPDGAPPRSASA
ncbi:MAG: hypothetical protein ACE5JG_06950 [Planctomycetota bacterium]